MVDHPEKYLIVGGLTGAVLLAAIKLAGFTLVGIKAHSIATFCMSKAAIAAGGFIKSGSLIATL